MYACIVAIRQTNTEAFDGRRMGRMLQLYMMMHMVVSVCGRLLDYWTVWSFF